LRVLPALANPRPPPRRTDVQIRQNIPKAADGLDDVDAFWDGEKSVTSRTTAAGASMATPMNAGRASQLESPQLSTPGFDLGENSSAMSSPAPARKTRQSIAASVGGLSEVSTPQTAQPLSDVSNRRDSSSTATRSNKQTYEDDNFSAPDGYDESTADSVTASRTDASSVTQSTAATPDAIRANRLEKKEMRRVAAEKKKRDAELRRAEKRRADEDARLTYNYDDDDGIPAAPSRITEKAAYLKFTAANTAHVSPDEDDDEEVVGQARRSKRYKVQPLQYWKNERIIYKPQHVKSIEAINLDDKDEEADYVFLSRIAGTLHALPSPEKPKRKFPARKAGSRAIAPLFDTTTLNQNLKYLNDDKAVVWDEAAGEYKNSKIISYTSTMQTTSLPITADREAGKDVVGLAAQAFNVPQATEDVPGWISGHVTLPPEGIKDAEGVGMCSQVFFVSDCQPKAFEVAIGAPDESTFNSATAQRFLLSAGDFFHVPPNNIYRIENHSTSHECKLFWTIIRPMANSE
jgi:centromere protein C